MLSSDEALPCDRPNLSKDYLAGTIPFDYVPLRQERFYADKTTSRSAWADRFVSWT